MTKNKKTIMDFKDAIFFSIIGIFFFILLKYGNVFFSFILSLVGFVLLLKFLRIAKNLKKEVKLSKEESKIFNLFSTLINVKILMASIAFIYLFFVFYVFFSRAGLDYSLINIFKNADAKKFFHPVFSWGFLIIWTLLYITQRYVKEKHI